MRLSLSLLLSSMLIGFCTSLHAQTANDFYNAGTAHGLKEEYNAAIAEFSKALDKQPVFAEALLSRGIC